MGHEVETAGSMTLQELRDELRRAEPRAFLVPLRILRRVIRADGKLGGLSLAIPHRKGWVLSRSRALELLAPDELGLGSVDEFPEIIILLIRPEIEKLNLLTREQILQSYWRLLFHARVHVAMDQAGLSGPAVHERKTHLGTIAFAEIRGVLDEERFLLPDASDHAVYVEFAAVFLELYYFAPHALGAYFPGIHAHVEVVEQLRRDLDDLAVLKETNLGGVSLPPVLVHDEYEPEEDVEPAEVAPSGPDLTIEKLWRLFTLRADRELARGNTVKAAILRTRASHSASGSERARTRSSAHSALDTFARRLKGALGQSDSEALQWKRALRPLLEPASRGVWPREARLLYTLQKICVEKDNEVYSVDLFGWATSLGKRPLKRPLPHHRETRLVRHLKDSVRLLRRVKLAETDRQRLGHLLDLSLGHAEHRLRTLFRPILITAFDENGVVPRNAVERAARRKLVEELLEKIVENGFLRFGNLRDDLSRNQIKLPDVAGPVEFFGGDRLLKTDKALAVSLEGVYRGGEIYMRWLQRFSSLLFGTRIGRALTCYLILPFGGAFVILEGLTHLINLFVHLADGVEPELMNYATLTILSVVILCAVNSAPYRQALWSAAKRIGRAIGYVLLDLPRMFISSELFQRLLDSRTFRRVWRLLLKPALVWGVLWLTPPVQWAFSWLAHHSPFAGTPFASSRWLTPVLTFVGLSLLFNSRMGRDGQEICTEGYARLVRRLRVDFLSGLFKFIEHLSDLFLETFERLLYAVDEKLRFRSDQNRLILVLKGIVGMFWFAITYVVRIYVNLLIEPQINPIKHFPVVTVSHKVILPMTPQIYKVIRTPFMPLGIVAANAIGVATVFLLPGVFGFLVWEFKENWKLFEANRSKTLKPEMVGHHGETLRGFLRPGFHSGTIPRAFARWRKAERKAQRRSRPALARKPRETLHHLEEKISLFVERAVLYLLDESQAMAGRKVEVTDVHLATNRIEIELASENLDDLHAHVILEENNGTLAARVDPPGWLAGLKDDTRNALESSIAALFVMSQVELLEVGRPRDFNRVMIPWNAWEQAWEQDASGLGHPDFLDTVVVVSQDSSTVQNGETAKLG